MSNKKSGKEAPPQMSMQNMPNAYDINPGMMEMLHSITPSSLPMFLMTNPDFVSADDKPVFEKGLKNLAKYTLASLLLGITVNVQSKRVFPGIVTLPFYFRLPLRMILLAAPFALFASPITKQLTTIDNLNRIYYMRIHRFRRTGKFEQLFPQQFVPPSQDNVFKKDKRP